MQWFRMYAEFMDDPKVQTLSESMQRRYIMLMCIQSKGDLQKLSEDEIAFALNLTKLKFSQTKLELIQKNLIQVENGKIFITNWDKRQYVSDNSTLRVKKHREKLSDETFQKRDETVTVTPPDTDTDTDTEKKDLSNAKSKEKCERKNFLAMPIQGDEEIDCSYNVTYVALNEMKELFPTLNVEQEFYCMKAWLKAEPKRYKTAKGMKRFYAGWLTRALKPKDEQDQTKRVG